VGRHPSWCEKIVTAVIDASALVAFCLNEDGLDRERLKAHFREGVISIELIRVESANAILISKRRGVTKDDAAELALSSLLELSTNNIRMISQDDELINDAFEMSENMAIAIYDLLYLSLAKRTGASLLSKDDGQIKAAKRLGITIENI
jgi:predicted nucleic acid-binding protein